MRNYREFFGGYSRSGDVRAIIRARQSGLLAKNDLRVFFAELEREQTGFRVPVDVILNKRRKQKKRMTIGQQRVARKRLREAVELHKKNRDYAVKIPRKFIQAAARGFLDTSAMVVALLYFTKRMPQRARRKSLVRGERYGRLSVRGIEAATGLCKQVIVKAIRILRAIKLIALVWRPKQEIKRFGSLFVDGSKVSISYHKPEHSRAVPPSARLQKTETVAPRKRNKKKETLTYNSFSFSSRVKRDAIGEFAARHCRNIQERGSI